MLSRIRDYILIIIFIFAAMGIFRATVYNIDLFDPVSDAIGEFDLTDMVFSKFRDYDDMLVDEDIVLVNIGNLPREGIAEQIMILNKYNPELIALDVMFRSPKEGWSDSLLMQAFGMTPNLILADELTGFDSASAKFEHVNQSAPIFSQMGSSGFVNIITDPDENVEIVREISLKQSTETDGDRYAFAVEIANTLDPDVKKAVDERPYEYEVINYTGKTSGFFTLDPGQVLNEDFTPDVIENKVILMGYLGPWEITPEPLTLEDAKYTPMNESYTGKALPDVYGLVVQANVVRMLLDRKWIGRMAEWMEYLIALWVCFLNVIFFEWLNRKYDQWYGGMAILIQLGETLLMMMVTILVFHYFDYKISLTLAMVTVILSADAVEIYDNVLKKLAAKARKKKQRGDTHDKTEAEMLKTEAS